MGDTQRAPFNTPALIALLLQMPFTRNIFSGAPWGWGDNQLASGIRGAAVKDLPFLQRHRGFLGGLRSSLCLVQVLCLGARMPPPGWKPSREKSPASRTFIRRRETVSVQAPLGHGCSPS